MVKDLEEGVDLTAVGAGTLEVAGTALADLRLSVGQSLVLASRCSVGTQLAEVRVERVDD